MSDSGRPLGYPLQSIEKIAESTETELQVSMSNCWAKNEYRLNQRIIPEKNGKKEEKSLGDNRGRPIRFQRPKKKKSRGHDRRKNLGFRDTNRNTNLRGTQFSQYKDCRRLEEDPSLPHDRSSPLEVSFPSERSTIPGRRALC